MILTLFSVSETRFFQWRLWNVGSELYFQVQGSSLCTTSIMSGSLKILLECLSIFLLSSFFDNWRYCANKTLNWNHETRWIMIAVRHKTDELFSHVAQDLSTHQCCLSLHKTISLIQLAAPIRLASKWITEVWWKAYRILKCVLCFLIMLFQLHKMRSSCMEHLL